MLSFLFKVAFFQRGHFISLRSFNEGASQCRVPLQVLKQKELTRRE